MNSNEIILEKLTRIEAKLDEVITAMHEYDGDFDNEEIVLHNIPSDVLKEAADTYNEYVANKRMDIIGQNGNTGEHYDIEDEFDDYGKRVGKKDNPKQMNGVESNVPFVKTRNKHDKWVSPYPPNPKRKSAVVEHQKYPPHKH